MGQKKMTKLEKDAWLNDIPELIYMLKKKYNFYYSGYYARISKDILDVVNPKKHKHKIVLYNRGQRFFLVIYKKDDFDIYFTNEYVNDDKHNRISYFVKKFRRAYKVAEEEYEEQIYTSNMVNTRRIQ